MKPPIVTNIIIFPSYVRKKRDQNDLALVRLETPLEFKPNTVQPICLPTGARFKDADISDAFVSGWGLRAQRDCNTIDKGPAKHQRCKFPFVWMNLTHTTCHSASTPSYSDKNCKLLADQQTTEGGLILEGMFGPLSKEQPELKVRQFQNEFMKSLFLPKYEQKIVKISALTTQGRNPDIFLGRILGETITS